MANIKHFPGGIFHQAYTSFFEERTSFLVRFKWLKFGVKTSQREIIDAFTA